MASSYYQANKIGARDFGATAYIPPTTYYIALSTTTINRDGSNCTEPSGSTGYARVAVPNNTTNWSAWANGECYNLLDISFGEATAQQGTILEFGIFDSLTGGNLLYSDALPTPKLIQSGAVAYFSSGTFKIKIS